MPNPARLAAVAVLFLVSVRAAMVSAAPGDAELRRAAALVDDIVATDSILAFALLEDLVDVWQWLPPAVEEEQIATLLRVHDPDLRAYVAYLQARELLGRGDVAGAEGVLHAEGYAQEWAIVGPFANDGMSGFTAELPPETGGDLLGPFAGKVEPVDWRVIHGATESGYLACSDLVAPAHSAVVYAATEFDARGGDAVIALAVDGAYRLWLNGSPVAEEPNHLGGAAVRDEVPVRLVRGRNVILVKLANVDEPLGLHLRVLDADRRPVRREFRAPTSLPAAQPADSWTRPRTAADRVAAALEWRTTTPSGAPGTDLRAVIMAAPGPADEDSASGQVDGPAEASRVAHALTLRSATRTTARGAVALHLLAGADPDEPWREYVDQATASSELAPDDAARLARMVEEAWRQDELLDRAHAAAPDDPWIENAWARAKYSRVNDLDAAAALVALRARVEQPDAPLPSRASWSAALSDLRLPRWGDRVALDLAADAPFASPAVLDAARAARRAGDASAALGFFEAYVAREGYSEAIYSELAEAAIAAGRPNDAAAAAERLVATLPNSPGAWENVARIWLAAGDLEAADDALTAALELAPRSSGLLEGRGRLRLERGMPVEATADLRDALALRPQDTSLRDALDALDVGADQFYAPYRVPLEQLVELAAAPAESGSFAYTSLVEQEVVRVSDNGLATRYVQRAFRADTRGGTEDISSFRVDYSPDSEVVDVVGVVVRRPDGSTQTVYDTRDYSSGGGESRMYFDVRARVVRTPPVEPGDIVSVEYTVAQVAWRNMFDDYFGDLWFVEDRVPRRLVRYVLLRPQSSPLAIEVAPAAGWTRDVVDGVQRLTFEERDVRAVRSEPAAPGPSEALRYLSVSTYANWDSLANWYWQLIEDQLVSSPEIIETARRVTADATTTDEIVDAVHEYVVRNTRYVGLEFGIHGFKPYRTSDIFARRFGDCKDTASLMKVMLAAVGVESHLVLIRTRDLGRVGEFPPSLALFNHAITYVPAVDRYLDGTATYAGAREVPSADQGASAVIVLDGQGGRFVTTPFLPAETNRSTTEVQVDLTGATPVARGTWSLTGVFAPGARSAYENGDGRASRLRDELAAEVPGVTLVDSSFEGLDDVGADVAIHWVTAGGQWAAQQGDAWVVDPFGVAPSLGTRYGSTERRDQPVSIPYPFEWSVDYRFVLPRGVSPVSLPEATEVTSPFGELRSAVSWEAGAVVAHASLRINATEIAPTEYEEFRAFVRECDLALGEVVRVRQGGAQ